MPHFCMQKCTKYEEYHASHDWIGSVGQVGLALHIELTVLGSFNTIQTSSLQVV